MALPSAVVPFQPKRQMTGGAGLQHRTQPWKDLGQIAGGNNAGQFVGRRLMAGG